MHDKKKLILGIILFGSIWGGLEAILISTMDGLGGFMPRSVVLAGVSLLVLAYARFMIPMKGSTLIIGLIAAGFKFLGLPVFYGCQYAAVIGQALVIEAAFTLAQRYGLFNKALPMMAVIVVAGYANSLLFSFSQAFIFQNHWWVDRGVSGLMQWSFGTGSLATLAGLAGFIVAMVLSKLSLAPLEQYIANHRAVFVRTAIGISVCFWLIGVVLLNEKVYALF